MTGTDKKGHPFDVRPYRSGYFPYLVEMYGHFSPKGRFQGMPPKEFGTLEKWLGMLIRNGENVLAWRQERVIGHVVLLPDFEKGDAEYLIFVNQFDRGQGVGSELTRAALQLAGKLGLKTVWLTVDAYNFRAVRLYRKFGFSFCEAYESPSERMLNIRVVPMTTLKTGIVRDERYLEHMPGHTHPEHPKRLKSIHRMLDEDFPSTLLPVNPEPATLEQLELVHTPAYIQKVLKTADHGFTSLAPDTPASAGTYMSAWLAVGGCLKGLESLVSGACDACFALVRPPGHHALHDRAGGFCIFNNIGITARFAAKRYGLKRILIIDWDIHHGNGVSDLFYEEKGVLYFSSHDRMLYPFSGDWGETGRGEGEGYTVNIPIPRAMDDGEFFHLYREIIGPIVRAYRPELILVAAGFDAHRDDPVGRSGLSEQPFGWLTRLLTDLSGEVDRPPMLFILEGGYNPRALALCVRETLEALTLERGGEGPAVEETGLCRDLIEKARNIHGHYGVW